MLILSWLFRKVLCTINIAHLRARWDDDGIHCLDCTFFKSRFEHIADLYKQEGLEIYNASWISTLTVFPKSDKLNRSGFTHKRGKNGRTKSTSRAAAYAAA